MAKRLPQYLRSDRARYRLRPRSAVSMMEVDEDRTHGVMERLWRVARQVLPTPA